MRFISLAQFSGGAVDDAGRASLGLRRLRRRPRPRAGPGGSPVRRARRRQPELRGRCTPGFVRRPRPTRAITEIPSLGGKQVFVRGHQRRRRRGRRRDHRRTGTTTRSATPTRAACRIWARWPGSARRASRARSRPDGAIGGHADRGDGTGILFGYRYTASGGRTELCPGGCSVWDLERPRPGGRAARRAATRRPGRRSSARPRRGCTRSGRWAGRAARPAASARPAWWSATPSSPARRPATSATRSSTTRAARRPRFEDLNSARAVAGLDAAQAANDVNE